MLRAHGVVGKFVEFFGAGPGTPDAAPTAPRIANMAPEYGATMGFFPVDDEDARATCARTGRTDEQVDAGRALLPRRRACSAPPTRRTPTTRRSLELDLAHRRAQPGRPEAAAGPHRRCGRCKATFRRALRSAGRAAASADAGATRRTGRSRRRAADDRATAPSSSPPSPAAPTPRNPSRDAGRRPAGQEGRRARA